MIIPSKVLLFGEYTVLLGGESLGIPFDSYFAKWKQKSNYPYREALVQYLTWMKTLELEHFSLDIDRAIDDVHNDWSIESNIPEGYGIGSSGAIVAAIVHRYGKFRTEDLGLIQQTLGLIEGYFHGKSSGFDPFISYMAKPIHKTVECLHVLENVNNDHVTFKLYDSGIKRSGKLAIEKFQKQLVSNDFKKNLAELNELNTRAIRSYLNNDSSIKKGLQELSQKQLVYFDFLIPQNVKEYWLGLDPEKSVMKLCGAGDGGYFIEFLFQ